MKRRKVFFTLATVFLVLGSLSIHAQTAGSFTSGLEWVNKVGAIQTPSSPKVFLASKYGAVSDTIKLSTKAIQSAIDACAKSGGGIVSLEPGIYLTGSIFLKSGVHLVIGKGVELRGSQNFDDYPEINTRIAGIEMKWPAALINIIDQKNVEVSGEGKVNARGKFCWDKYWNMRKEYDPKGLRWIVDYDAKRIRTFLAQNSSDVTLKGLTFINAGFWTVQLLYSTRITVDGLVIKNNVDGKGPSTDGIDVDSSSWVLIQNCDIDCNDDDFCLKSGRDWDGLRVNIPTEYVVIRKCIARKGGGLLTLGSETAGYIKHVLAEDLVARGTGNGFHIKSAITRGGGVEDIHLQNIQMDSVGNAFLFTMNWNPAYSYSTLPAGYNIDSVPAHWKTILHKVEPPEKGIPHFKDIYVSSINVASARKVFMAEGMKESPLQNFNFRNVTIKGDVKGSISHAAGWTFENVTLKTKEEAPLAVKNSVNMKL
jgi:polygalacturonase